MKKSIVLLPLVVSTVSAQTESDGLVRIVHYVFSDTRQGWGPFPPIIVQEEGLAAYTVYRPKDTFYVMQERVAFIGYAGNHRRFAMQVFRSFLIMFLTSIASIGNAQDRSIEAPLTTVENVDLQRYAGKWYEISKLPNRFQRHCVAGTTAQYAIRTDGKIDVINRCKKEDGQFDEAVGIAEVMDTVSNAKLKVSFVRFLWRWWFWGDYWIIGLGQEYDYAIIGTPSRQYGWVLSRTPVMDPDIYEAISEELKNQGYNPGDFEKTQQ